MKNCVFHGEYEPETVLIGGKPLNSPCPKCAEFNAAMLDIEAVKKAEELRQKNLKRMNIAPLYYGATLDTYMAESTDQQRAKSTIERLVKGELKKIVMTGTNGTGKTHLACAALHRLGGRIHTMYEISALIRSSYTPLARNTELEIVDDLARLPLLVIDEIGRTKGSETEANWLSYIIDKRHAWGLPLIMISNKHLKKYCQTEEGCPDCLENYIGEDIMSRLAENSVLLRFNGEDYRKRRKVA